MKAVIANAIKVLLVLYVKVCFANHPTPYESIQTLRPFVDEGWYYNATQLHNLISKYQVKTILEVGSWFGKSTVDLARRLPEDGKIYAVDHWLGSDENQEGQPHYSPHLPYLYEQFLSNIIHAGLTDKVIPIRMNSCDAARSTEIPSELDLIYIDASHDTESVYQDLCLWFPRVKEKGVLCGDDWACPSVRLAVERFAKEEGLKISAVCTGHGGNFWRLY